MTSKQWREAGYRTIFRDGYVYLYRPLSGITIRTENRRGKWMEYNDINKHPWEKLGDCATQFEHIAEACYCDSMGGYIHTCDFCQGIREPSH
jgi:hypothetical protein